MVYHAQTGYYYLFVSYGSLKSDYNIRVGRSRSVMGPFLDAKGRSLTDISEEDNLTGNLLMGGYQWNSGTAYMAPGHNSVLQNDKGEWYLLCHIREKNFTFSPEPSTMQIRKIFWSSDGWPYVSCEVYAGETEQKIDREDLTGGYEQITFFPMLPQGISTAVPVKLGENDYYECCSIQGKWKVEKEKIRITYGSHRIEGVCGVVWDWENDRPTFAWSGLLDGDTAVWAKKTDSLL